MGSEGQWGPEEKPMARSLGVSPPETGDTFGEIMLFCHGFKNDMRSLPTSVRL